MEIGRGLKFTAMRISVCESHLRHEAYCSNFSTYSHPCRTPQACHIPSFMQPVIIVPF